MEGGLPDGEPGGYTGPRYPRQFRVADVCARSLPAVRKLLDSRVETTVPSANLGRDTVREAAVRISDSIAAADILSRYLPTEAR